LEGVRIADRDGYEAQREVRQVAAYGGAVELGPYRHFMQKEIFEQPRAITDTIPQADSFDASLFGEGADQVFAEIDNLLILACGTSYYSGLTAKYWLESVAKIPTQVEIASEYRYRESVPNPKSLVVVISQSGETADTLAALKHAQALGHKHTLSVCNVGTSAMVRQTALSFLTHAC
ncbi:SIS domain-containing protein, partial [Desulfobacter hydrogenophilus]|nr:SIS domain-containing protein [Desulfobacter hydrogenophilus]